jgi:hypothetical protein
MMLAQAAIAILCAQEPALRRPTLESSIPPGTNVEETPASETDKTATAVPPRWRLLGQLHLEPRGIFVVNVSYNSGTLYPGTFALFATPPLLSRSQFFISPQNTVVGFKLAGLTLGNAAISGAMDVNLRSSTIATANTIGPQFYDVHIQLEAGRFRLFVGQFPDVLLPFVPDTVNSFPAGAVPGAIGYVRPQIRLDVRVPIHGDAFQLIGQTSLNRPIQTFELTDELAGRQAGVPDVQGRLVFALGASERPWERPFEVGVAGHVGRRRLTGIDDGVTSELGTWSVVADARGRTSFGTVFKARAWWGALLGDYAAAIYQTVNPLTRRRIRAQGFWAEVQQRLSQRWRAGAIYGRDNPKDADLAPGQRQLNQAGFLNVFWDASKILGFGTEASHWRTRYDEATETEVWRGDLLFFLRF